MNCGGTVVEEASVLKVHGGEDAVVAVHVNDAVHGDGRRARGDGFGLLPEQLAGDIAGGGGVYLECLEVGFAVAGVDGDIPSPLDRIRCPWANLPMVVDFDFVVVVVVVVRVVVVMVVADDSRGATVIL